jgi:hypothetical protein
LRSLRADASAMTVEDESCGPNNEGFAVYTERSPVTSPTTVGPADLTNTVSFTIVIR